MGRTNPAGKNSSGRSPLTDESLMNWMECLACRPLTSYQRTLRKVEVGKTFGTGLPAPSEEPPRLNFAQNERAIPVLPLRAEMGDLFFKACGKWHVTYDECLPRTGHIIKMGRTIRNGDRVNLSAEETSHHFLRSDWPRPFARREVGVEMELGRSENKRPEQREILN
ncbi:hypothetical protein TNCV_1717661 [Trichonephila clavipes]|nr:hypothetical protein TNCV_1717661 [Trichonephila clavipes]